MVALQRSLDKSVQLTLRRVLLTLSSVILLAVLALLGTTQYMGSRLATVYADRVVPLHELQRIGYLLNVEIPGRLADTLDHRRAQAPQWREIDSLWRQYMATYLTPEEARLARQAGEQLLALRKQVEGSLNPPSLNAYHQHLLGLNTSLNALTDLQVRVAQEALLEARAAGHWAQVLGLLVGVIGMGLVALAVGIVNRRIVAPIRASTAAIAALADGQLEAVPAARSALSGDFAEIGDQLRRLRSFLGERLRLLEEEQQRSQLLRNTQAELVEAEKLASLGSLVAGVSHELNTPLGVAVAVSSGLSERSRRFAADMAAGPLRRSMLEGFVGHVAESSALMEKNLQRAAELLRSFKQVAVDRTGMQRRRFDLATTVGEVIASLRPLYGRHGVELINEVPADVALDSYPGALGQALNNLLVNAAVHGLKDRPGQVRVALEGPAGDPLQLVVSDNGSGMSEAVQARAFEPFFTSRLGSGGSGLGLPIVRNIVMGILGGRITLSSEPGHGSRFILQLPRTAPAPTQQSSEKVIYAAQHGKP